MIGRCDDVDTRRSGEAVALLRRDDFSFYRASSSFDVTRRGTLELSYEKRDNASTIRTFDFNQQLVSLRASFLF